MKMKTFRLTFIFLKEIVLVMRHNVVLLLLAVCEVQLHLLCTVSNNSAPSPPVTSKVSYRAHVARKGTILCRFLKILFRQE